MSVALELRRAALEAGDRAVFVPSGQTGMMIDGWGVAVDRVISDFLNGTVEWLVEQGEEMGDWILVEGQGSLDFLPPAPAKPRTWRARPSPRWWPWRLGSSCGRCSCCWPLTTWA